MRYFLDNDEEICLIKFIAKYQYININDVKYFFKSTKYYKKRVKNLVDKEILKRVKWNLVLGSMGIRYAQFFSCEYNKRNLNKKYKERLIRIANIGAFYNNCETVKFTPSFAIKDKEVFTTTGRRFVGILDVSGFDYLTYQITKEHDQKYVESVIWDIQKEQFHNNFIVLVDDIKRINLMKFAFGKNEVLIIEDTVENRQKLKYLHNIRWENFVHDFYDDKVYLSGYNFCDYTDYKDKFISLFFFVDTEKIMRNWHFLNVNKYRNATIICPKEIEELIRNELPTANYVIIELENYIDREIHIYDELSNFRTIQI